MTIQTRHIGRVAPRQRQVYVLGTTIALLATAVAHGQTLPSSNTLPDDATSDVRSPATNVIRKSTISELPPPDPTENSVLPKGPQTGPLAPNSNPFSAENGPSVNHAPLPVTRGGEPLSSEPGYFGAVTDDRQELPGVRIVEVDSGGPADVAGLRSGDLITSINDQTIREMADVAKVFTSSLAGQRLKIIYQRGGTASTPGPSATLDVTLGQRPAENDRRYPQFGRIDADAIPKVQAARPSGMLLGLRSAPLDAGAQRRLGVPVHTGALVLDVAPGSPAERAGIPRDAVVISFNGLLIDSPDALTREVLQAGPGAEIELGYYLGRNLIKRQLVLGGAARAHDGVTNSDENFRAQAAARIVHLEQQVQVLQRRLEQLEQQQQ